MHRRRDGFCQAYRYESVADEEIRSFCLEEGSEQDEIVCSIKTLYPGRNLQFEAQSYTWCHYKDSDSVTINVDRQILRISNSLLTALFDLRSPAQAPWLCIDAISINQNDND